MAFPENGAGGCLLPSFPFPLIFLPHSLSNSFPPFPSSFPFPFPIPFLLPLSPSAFLFFLLSLPCPLSLYLPLLPFPSSFLFWFSFPIPLSFPSPLYLPLSPRSKQVGRIHQYAVLKVPIHHLLKILLKIRFRKTTFNFCFNLEYFDFPDLYDNNYIVIMFRN